MKTESLFNLTLLTNDLWWPNSTTPIWNKYFTLVKLFCFLL